MSPAPPSSTRPDPVAAMMLPIPQCGIKRNPVARLPAMLPSVDQKNTSPDALPTPLPASRACNSVIANGESIARNRAGRKNIRKDTINGPLIRDSL